MTAGRKLEIPGGAIALSEPVLARLLACSAISRCKPLLVGFTIVGEAGN